MGEDLSASFQKFDEICKKRDHSRGSSPAPTAKGGGRRHDEYVREFTEQCQIFKRRIANTVQSIPQLRNLPLTDTKELREFDIALNTEQERWIDTLWSSVLRLRKRCRSLVENVSLTAVDGEMLRKLIAGFEHDLGVFKEKQRILYDELEQQQTTLEDALQHMEKRFDSWVTDVYSDKDFKNAQAQAKVAAAKPDLIQEPAAPGSRFDDPQLKKLRRELDDKQGEIDREGGEYGFWSREDHETFQRLYLKHNMSPEKPGTLFYKTCGQLLHLRSHEQIVEHVNWYTKSEERKEEKRKLLQAWRERKNELANAQLEEVTQDTLKDEQEQKKKKIEQDQQRREQSKKKVENWKVQRKSQEESEKARKIQMENAKKKRKNIEIAAEQHEKREMVKIYKANKAKEKEILEFQPPERQEIDKETKERINSRYREQWNKRMILLSQNRPTCSPPTPQTPKRYQYVKPRLHEQTECFIQKMRMLEEKSIDLNALGAKYTTVPGNWAHQAPSMMRTELATPNWRKNRV